ncbi:uncharacterized protein V1516DRAFT_678784 [Lipomyces oligophaga]|uniref:uncharacterized protein n=1 Tax=Lipomyces oligophaga TaxID=45792 RepID=UPI0034D0069F
MSEQPESKAQEQARLRRERREARILSGGNSRLDQIANTGHGEDTSFTRKHQPTIAQRSSTVEESARETADAVFDDPPDVFPSLAPGSATPADNPLLQLLRSGPGDVSGSDPMLEELLKNLGSGNASEGSANTDFFTSMLQRGADNSSTGGTASGPGGSDQASQPNAYSDYSFYWKTIHLVSVLLLSLYSVMFLEVRGSQLARIETHGSSQNSKVLLYLASIELALQSSRFMIERGRPPSKSIFTKVAGFLPAPYSNYLLLLARYTHIVTNVVTDFSLMIFVLGLASWYHDVEL